MDKVHPYTISCCLKINFRVHLVCSNMYSTTLISVLLNVPSLQFLNQLLFILVILIDFSSQSNKIDHSQRQEYLVLQCTTLKTWEELAIRDCSLDLSVVLRLVSHIEKYNMHKMSNQGRSNHVCEVKSGSQLFQIVNKHSSI